MKTAKEKIKGSKYDSKTGVVTFTVPHFSMYMVRHEAASPAQQGSVAFTDVKSGQWYINSAAWASEKTIAKGFEGNSFLLNANITIEQLAVISYNYNKAVGNPVEASENGYNLFSIFCKFFLDITFQLL